MHKLTAFVAFACVAAASQAQTVWYGGDFNGTDGFASQVNGVFTDILVYDDFTLSSGTSLDGVFGNYLYSGSAGSISSLYYEIRTGMSPGNGGTVIDSGFISATMVATGNSGFGLTEYNVAGSISPLALGAGTYWLGLAVDGGDGAAYASMTSGANGIGSPLNNGGALWNSPTYSYNFADVALEVGYATADVSFGVSAVPEPATMAVLGLGAAALLRRRRKNA